MLRSPLQPLLRKPMQSPVGLAVGNLINRVMTFSGRLSNSITPQRGSAATFTRSTTATFVDQDSVVRTANINEARFPGLRRVGNLAPYSQDLTNAFWVKQAAGSGSLPVVTPDAGFAIDGSKHADLVVLRLNGGTSATDRSEIAANFVTAAGISYLFSLEAYTSDGSTVVVRVDYGGISGKLLTITPTPTRFAANVCTTPGAGYYPVIRLRGGTGTSDFASVYITNLQIENVTGQSVQTVGEYVSTNVLSSPYHGAGVDGVKYLTTTLAGAPLSGKFLSEPARTNLLIRSQEFDDAAWTKGTTTVSANNITAPDGTSSADLITSADEVGVYQGITVTPGEVYTASVFFKKDTCTIYRFRDVSDDHHVVFTVATKTFSSPFNVISYGYQELSDGWFRLWITYTAVGSTSAHNLRPNSQAGSTSYWQWGAQLEVGNRASSYIPTAGSAVTRAADSLSYPVTASPTQGGFSCTLVPAEAPATAAMFYAVGLFGATNADVLGLYTDAGTSDLSCYVRRAGASTLNLLLGTIVAGTTYKVAISWAGTAVKASVNGGAVVSGTASNMPTSLSSFNNSIDTVWNGQLSDVKVFTQALSDNTLRQLTT